ncbi:MAG: PEP-utilizing enzyme [bacterium]
MNKKKTLYLWDLAGTIFFEKWNTEKTGFQTYSEWTENKTGRGKEEISAREREEMYEIPFKEGWYFNLDIMPGAKEVLKWAKNNEAFTTGVKEQIAWRAQYLKPKIGFNIAECFQKVNSVFDYDENGVKTKEMLTDYLNKKYKEGYKTVVYTDDNLGYCEAFVQAAGIIKKRNKDFSFRLYRTLNNNSGLRKKGGYYEIGSLRDLLKNEKTINAKRGLSGNKNNAQIKKKLNGIEWYQQAAAVKPLYVSHPCWHACLAMRMFGKKIPPKYELCVYYKDNFMEDYISKRSLEKVAEYYYNKQKKNKNFIQNLFSNWQENYVSSYLKMADSLLEYDFRQYTNNKLLILFQEFTKAYLNVWYEAIFLDGFDYYGEKILNEIFKKENKEIKSEDLEILLSPPFPSFLQRERLSLLKIIEKIFKNTESVRNICKIKRYNLAIKRYPWMEQELIKHSNMYHWLHNDFSCVELLNPQYFFKNIISLIKDKKKTEEERQMRGFLKSLNSKKQKLFKTYSFSNDFINIINFLSLLGNFRDERKSYNQIASSVLNKFALEFSKRTKLEINTIEHLFYWEIKNVFNLEPRLIKIAKERPKGAFYIIKPSNAYVCITGARGAALNDCIKESIKQKNNLCGMTAYKGFVRGTAKIVKSKNDFHKFKKGEILVAPNTRPEYVPIIKIASAIISEEGGITCHSAIVSRELKIPCIVGVQGIISALKDGDLVEVDANKGIVKILKK